MLNSKDQQTVSQAPRERRLIASRQMRPAGLGKDEERMSAGVGCHRPSVQANSPLLSVRRICESKRDCQNEEQRTEGGNK